MDRYVQLLLSTPRLHVNTKMFTLGMHRHDYTLHRWSEDLLGNPYTMHHALQALYIAQTVFLNAKFLYKDFIVAFLHSYITTSFL